MKNAYSSWHYQGVHTSLCQDQSHNMSIKEHCKGWEIKKKKYCSKTLIMDLGKDLPWSELPKRM